MILVIVSLQFIGSLAVVAFAWWLNREHCPVKEHRMPSLLEHRSQPELRAQAKLRAGFRSLISPARPRPIWLQNKWEMIIEYNTKLRKGENHVLSSLCQ
jgi:hypothetical protein